MRLIDADKLHYIRKWFEESGKSEIVVFGKEIDKAPTVDAIPIEWIKDRLQKAVDFTHSKAEGKFIDNGCVVSVVSANFTANVLMSLLEDWEKENDKDSE